MAVNATWWTKASVTVATVLAGLGLAAVVVTPDVVAAPAIARAVLPRPAGLEATVPMVPGGVSGDGRYVTYRAGGAGVRFDRVSGGSLPTPPASAGLSASGRFTRVGATRVDLDTGAIYDPGVTPAGCCNDFGGPRLSADGAVYTIVASTVGGAVGYVVDAVAGTLTALPGTGSAVSGDGRWVVVQGAAGVVAYDRLSGTVVPTVGGGATMLSYDGRYSVGLFSSGAPFGADVKVYDRATDTTTALRDLFPAMPLSYPVGGLRSITDDGQRVVYVDIDGRIQLIDLEADELVTITPDPIAFTGYDTVFLSGDGHTLVWTAGTDVEIATIGDSAPPPTTTTTTTVGGTVPPTSPPGSTPSFGALVPARLLDSRHGESDAVGNVGAQGVVALPVAGHGGVPVDARAVVLNVTATNPMSAGFVTVWPCDQARPTASNLNFAAGQTIANAVVTSTASDGTVCLYTHATTDLVVDTTGYFQTAP